MESKKWYGLTISKKAVKVNTKGKSIFDSDDSDENADDRVKIKKGPTSPSKEKRKKKIPDIKQEEVDSNIYEYDSIYDEMKSSQKQKTSHIKSKEPRYINLLLKAAEKRKKESERRVERKIQAERVKEGDEFKDKEAFVTSAYRQKMIEMEEEEERERRENALEETMDSTKQKDLSGFYRHFLKQTVGEEKIPEFGERDAKICGTSKIKQEYMGSNKSRQRSGSPSDARDARKHSSLDYEDDHSDKRKEPEKSRRSDSLHKSAERKQESKQSPRSGSDKSEHSKDKASSHRNKTRHQSDSPSDSEERKSKHSSEKSHKKSDHSIHSSKHERDRKSKYSHSSRTHDEKKMYDQYKHDHSKDAMQKASSEKHSDGHSPSKSHYPQRSKHDKDREEYKKEKMTHSETEKRSSQTNLQSTSAYHNHSKDKRSSSNENKVDYSKSKRNSCDDQDSNDEKHSSSTSKKRENRNEHYSETKRRKFNYDDDDNDDDDDDDDDQSTSSSGEEEVSISEVRQKDESEKVPEKPKTDIMSKFAKRTLGKIFEDAQERYFRRRDAKAVS